MNVVEYVNFTVSSSVRNEELDIIATSLLVGSKLKGFKFGRIEYKK